MNREVFEQIVIEALDSLPDEFQQFMRNIEVRVESRPTREQRRALGLRPWQSLYGLYEGTPLTEREGFEPFLPDIITIFQTPLERDFPGRDELRDQVRRTVLHEIAHFFGISDERLEELDAY